MSPISATKDEKSYARYEAMLHKRNRDRLSELPPKRHQYVDSMGRRAFDSAYDYHGQRVYLPLHPKVVAAKKAGTLTQQLERLYENVPRDQIIILAGYSRDDLEKHTVPDHSGPIKPEPAPAEAPLEPPEALPVEAASTISVAPPQLSHAPGAVVNITPKKQGHRSKPFHKKGKWGRRIRVSTARKMKHPFFSLSYPHYTGPFGPQEDGFHNRPSIRLPMPDHLKAALVDDWENVTKNQQLVPLPHRVPVEIVLDDYLEFERPHREPGSASHDILEETVAGLREYFDKCLGRILLYRFERPQYIEMHQIWESGGPHKSPIDTYGVEHLCRLLVSLPELISQTNMDQQSVNRLRDELTKFTTWLSKNMVKYFVSEYETPNQQYVDQVRSA